MEFIKCVSNTTAVQSFATNNGTVCFRVASGFTDRLVGLLSRAHLSDDDGLLFPKCSAVHTFGMRFSIDVLFLDADCRVVKIATMNPWRIQSVRGACSVLELNAGAAKFHELKIGQILWTL